MVLCLRLECRDQKTRMSAYGFCRKGTAVEKQTMDTSTSNLDLVCFLAMDTSPSLMGLKICIECLL